MDLQRAYGCRGQYLKPETMPNCLFLANIVGEGCRRRTHHRPREPPHRSKICSSAETSRSSSDRSRSGSPWPPSAAPPASSGAQHAGKHRTRVPTAPRAGDRCRGRGRRWLRWRRSSGAGGQVSPRRHGAAAARFVPVFGRPVSWLRGMVERGLRCCSGPSFLGEDGIGG